MKSIFQINKIKESISATLQAIVADDAVQVEFLEDLSNNFFEWKQDLVADSKTVSLPVVQSDELINSYRAAADMAACYLLFHDKELHQQRGFDNLDEQKLFDEFEKVRVIANVGDVYRGVVRNILQKVESDVASGSGRDASIAMLLFREFSEVADSSATGNLIANLERSLSAKILQKIKNLSDKISNQEGFATAVLDILESLKEESESEKNEEEEDQPQQKNQKSKNNLANFGQENIDAKDEQKFAPNDGEEQPSEAPAEDQKISEFKEDKDGGDASVRLDKSGFEEDKIEFKNAYKIFTSKFDEVIFPQKLVGKTELEILRDQLDLRLAKLTAISKKMSLKLKKKLMAKKNSFVERDNAQGILDRKKLTQFLLNPQMEDIWINNKERQYQDTALTILLDNSGSMRGNPIVMSALACEIIASILEKFSVKTEIIGFTTADWKGGKARKLWESQGSPKNPGRLNELRNIVYKSFDQSFKKSKINLGLMLKEGILKENIDGEALLFARSRLMQRDEKRKILMVISDGTPVDDSTTLANDNEILSDHLAHVIHKIEKQKLIELVGIGIGHTTDDFYKNSITIKGVEELGDVMIEKIIGLV